MELDPRDRHLVSGRRPALRGQGTLVAGIGAEAFGEVAPEQGKIAVEARGFWRAPLEHG